MADCGTPELWEASKLARIGLVYEDEAIRIFLEIMSPQILGVPVELEPLRGGAWPGIVGDVSDLLQALSVEHITNPLDCVLVVVDANGTGPNYRVQRLKNKVGNRRFRFGVPIYHSIVRQVETWLLGDPQAINTAAGRVIPVVHQPELMLDPKRHLIKVLENNHARPYGRAFQRAFAQSADVGAIAAKCPGFQTFVEKLRQCLQQGRLFQQDSIEE